MRPEKTLKCSGKKKKEKKEAINRAIIWVATFPFSIHVFMWFCARRETNCASSFHPLWVIFMMIYSRTSSGNVDNLKQPPPLPPPWAINRVKIRESFSLQRREEEASLEHRDYSVWTHGGAGGNSKTQWRSRQLVLLTNRTHRRTNLVILSR